VSFIDRIEGPGETQDLPEKNKSKETGGFSKFQTKQNLELFNKVMERENGPGWEKNANLPALPKLEEFSAETFCMPRISSLTLTDEKRASMEREYFGRTGKQIFVGWDRVPDELKPPPNWSVGKKLRHSRTRMEKTLARRKGRYSKE
tara:strand:- start:12 stop:452 length:441 start_codon:yes stop_codon:yes gene_type:complete